VRQKISSIEIVEEGSERVVVTKYKNGDAVRSPVSLTQNPTRKPKRPYARAGFDRMNKTRKKRY
jgi:hypothetical protein